MRGRLTMAAARGVTWFGLAQVVNQGLRFVAMIVLARLLLPEYFGVVAAAAIVAELAMDAIGLGFGEAIIQRKEVTTSHLSTSFWTGLMLGAAFCIVVVLVAPFVADLFGDERVCPVLRVMSVCFLLAPLRSVHGSLLRKRLEFFKFSIGEMAQGLAYVITATVVAFVTRDYWSLVFASVASQIAMIVARWALCRWWPSLTFSVDSLRDLWGFGSRVTATRLVQFAAERLDQLIIGIWLSTTTLGFYYFAHKIASYPASGLLMSVSRVAFPTFSKVQDEDERLRRGFTKSVVYVSVIVFPMFAGLALVAPELVRLVYGQQWIPAILPLQILCIMTAIAAISVTVAPLFRAKGRPDIELKLILVRLAIMLPCLLVSVQFGLAGVAIGVSSVVGIMWLVRQTYANRLVGLKMRDYARSLYPAVLGALVMSLLLVAYRSAASALGIPDIGLLASSVVLGAVAYFAVLKMLRVQALNEMIGLALSVVGPYSNAARTKISSYARRVARMGATPRTQE